MASVAFPAIYCDGELGARASPPWQGLLDITEYPGAHYRYPIQYQLLTLWFDFSSTQNQATECFNSIFLSYVYWKSGQFLDLASRGIISARPGCTENRPECFPIQLQYEVGLRVNVECGDCSLRNPRDIKLKKLTEPSSNSFQEVF